MTTMDPLRWRESGEVEGSIRTAIAELSRPHPGDREVLARIGAHVPAIASGAAAGGLALKVIAWISAGVLAAGIATLADRTSPAPILEPRPVMAERSEPRAAEDPIAPQLPARAPRRRAQPRLQAEPIAEPPPAQAPTPADDSTLREEARLLLLARRRIDTDPADASALLDLYDRRFSQGELQEERAVVAIEIACALGRRDEVMRAASSFLLRHERSPHRARVEQLAAAPCDR